MAVLIGMSAEVKGKSFPVDRDNFTIGRKPDNAIMLDNPTVSSHHCAIISKDGRFFLNDLGSTNGTLLNAKEVSDESRLRPRDLVQVGSVEFLFDAEETPEDAVTSPATRSFSESTKVEEATGSVAAPESFTSISPFGTRRRESKGWTMLLIVLVGALALIGVVYLVFNLVMAGR